MDEIPFDLPIDLDDSLLDMFDVQYPEDDDEDLQDILEDYDL
jgi:hypothetical protein